jgi:predicted PurR-regulated permease PerM
VDRFLPAPAADACSWKTWTSFSKTVPRLADGGIHQGVWFSGLVLGLIMVPIYLFFFLKDSASIRTQWHYYVPLKASHFKTSLVDTLQEIKRLPGLILPRSGAGGRH